MSAFYSFVYPDRVCLLTDGGFFDEEGILRLVASKVFAVPGKPMAITGRGSPSEKVFAVINDLATCLSQAPSVDRAMDEAKLFFRTLAAGGLYDAEFLIAAYCETSGPSHFFVQCHGHWDIPSFELVSPGVQICGGPEISINDLAHLNLSDEELLSPDFPAAYGMEVMSAMRRKRGSIPGTSRAFYGVAGTVDLTTITEAGTQIVTLAAWEDEIGKAVDPSSDVSAGSRS
ncbi:MAG: hypothetical protein K0M49_10220 [Arenimonas sp.]|nr:hypothetical protein [Arenimonas sp.]